MSSTRTSRQTGAICCTSKHHLGRWIKSGEIDVYTLLPIAMIDSVLAFLKEHPKAGLTDIRKGTGDTFDYNDIRMVVAHHSRGGAPG